MNSVAANQYQNRLRKVLEYVDTHLDDALTVDELCSVAAFSKYHFHRQFSAFFGINAFRYVQLTRLKRAAHQLAYRDTPIMNIALACSYESPEAFTRAFKKNIGQTPSNFRQQPQWNTWFTTYQFLRELRMNHMTTPMRQVNIVTTPDIKVAALEHRGSPQLLGNSIRKFIEWRKQHHLHPDKSATYNILYDDPDATEADQYRFDLCAATSMEVTENSTGIIGKVIPGGRCAVLRHIGSDDLLRASFSYLYSTWLPASGEELRNFPLYLQRVKFFPDVPEHEAVIDIFVPLK